MTNERLPMTRCQQKLALIWMAASAVLFALLILQSLLGKYGDQTSKAWAWFLPLVLPTLTLIVSAVAYSAKQSPTTDTVDPFAYRLSQWLSVFYLLLVAVVPLTQPITGVAPLELMARSSLWLGPVQGVVGIAVGIFFASRQPAAAGAGG